MKTPDYRITEEYGYSKNGLDSLILPAMAFVKPIERQHLPQHILKSDGFRMYDSQHYVYCYTRFGIIPIPTKLIRRA